MKPPNHSRFQFTITQLAWKLAFGTLTLVLLSQIFTLEGLFTGGTVWNLVGLFVSLQMFVQVVFFVELLAALVTRVWVLLLVDLVDKTKY